MLSPVYRLFYHLALATDRELAKQVQYLKVENRILREKLPKRITITRSERLRLLKFGKPVGLAIQDLVTIVVPSTFARWVREAKDRKSKKSPKTGRPKKPIDLKQLILKIARETGWGYTRILGEIRKLTTHKISRQTVANILREAGFDPGPQRGEKTWDEFIQIHAHSLWQADFLRRRAITLTGFRDLYVLAFLNVATRRVYVTPATAHPNAHWVADRAKEFATHAQDNRLPADIIFHDGDRKFGKAFDAALLRSGLRPKRLSPRSPNTNAFIERWIQSIQVECLDHFIVFGEAHLNHLVREYVEYYHEERPHQGIDNKLIESSQPPPDEDIPPLKTVRRHERLGGLLKHYERVAA